MNDAGTRLDAARPWPGLDAFHERDAAFFRGREVEIEALVDLVSRARLTVLFGRSGLGKSSLLQAGLAPRLRGSRFLPVYLRLRQEEESPPLTEQVWAAMEEAAAASGIAAPARRHGDSLWEHLHREDHGFWSPDHEPVEPVIVLDQFEELFTLGRETERRVARCAAFLEELGDLVEGRVPESVRVQVRRGERSAREFGFRDHRYRFVIAMREDMIAELEALVPRIPSIAEFRYRLQPLDGEAALRVTQAGGPELVPVAVGERIVRLVGGAAAGRGALRSLVVDPVFLSLLCRELNEDRLARGAQSIAATDVGEETRDAKLRAFYARAFDGLDPAVRQWVEDALLTRGNYRDSVALDNALAAPGITRQVLATLEARRLVRRDERDGRARVELTHDVLVDVVRESRDRRLELEATAAAQAARQHAEAEQARERARAEEAERGERRARSAARRARIAAGVAIALGLTAAVALLRASSAQRSVRASAARLQYANSVTALERNDLSAQGAWLATVLRLDADLPQARAAAAQLLMSHRALPFPALHHEAWPGEVAAAVSPDGSIVATATTNGARLWNVRTGEELGSLGPAEGGPDIGRVGNSNSILAVQFSPDGSRVLTVSYDVIRVWDAQTRLPRGAELDFNEHLWMAGMKAVKDAAFSPDGTRLATGHQDGTAHLWDAEDGSEIGAPMRHGDAVNAVVFSPDGSRVATISEDGTAQLWDVRSGAPVGKRMVHDSAVVAVAFSPDGTRLATASRDQTARLWDARTGDARRAPLQHGDEVLDVAFSPDGAYLATASSDGTARLWDAQTGSHQGVPLQHEAPVSAVAFSPDGSRLATASSDGGVRLWDVRTSQPLGAPMQHNGAAIAVLFAADGNVLVTAADDGSCRMWRADPVAVAGAVLPQPEQAHTAAFSPDGALLAVPSGQVAQLWDAQTGVPIGNPMKHDSLVTDLEFSPDGSRLATVSRDGTARFWNPRTGAPIGAPMAHDSAVYRAAFSSDGLRLATLEAYANAVRLWDARTGAPIGAVMKHDSTALALAFSPDGSVLATGSSDGIAQLWDARTGLALGIRMRHTAEVSSIAFHPRSELLATSSDKTVQLWCAQRDRGCATLNGFVAPGKPIGADMKHERFIWAVAFSPDGRRLATASSDRTARLWNGQTGTPIGAPMRHQGTAYPSAKMERSWLPPPGVGLLDYGMRTVAHRLAPR